MLGKLLKYEFKSTSRVLWFLYAGLIAVSLIFGLVIRVNINVDDIYITPTAIQSNETLGLLMSILLSALGIIYVLLIYAIFITTTVVIVMRFYKNMLGGEGYLMHTLPVKTSSLIISKIITSFCWMLIAGVVVVISTIVLGFSSGIVGYALKYADWQEIVEGFRSVMAMFGVRGWTFILLLIVSSISSIITYYTSMAIGNLANNHKFLFSVLAYVGIGIVLSIILSITSVVGGMNILEGASSANYTDFTTQMEAFMSYNIWTTIGTQVAIAVGGFFLTNYLLSKKLNLA